MMPWWHALLLGVVEGLTEFLPVSSTGHLTIVEGWLGYTLDDPDVVAFTAIIQVGAIMATILYFRGDIVRLVVAWARGLRDPVGRQDPDYRLGWAVILGSVPIGLVGLALQDEVETSLRSLWVVALALIVWSGVMWVADRRPAQSRTEADTTWRDTLFIGMAQCVALVPGVSRSGATMSAGLARDFDRVTVTRLSFFLSIPALTAAGALQMVTEFDTISGGVGWGPTALATAVSFVVAYAAIAWLLRFVAHHSFTAFILYRVVLGVVLLALLATGVLDAT